MRSRAVVAAVLTLSLLAGSAVVAPPSGASPSLGCADPVVAAPPCPTGPSRVAAAVGPLTYTWSVATRGRVRSSAGDFAAEVASVYADARGWSLGGSIRFVQVPSGGSFTVWLAEASTVPSFSSLCSAAYSCQVGRDVIVNDDRWTSGSPLLAMGVNDYRAMVVNHETGHWLGLNHSTCPGPNQAAFVMQQQSKGGGFLGACRPNPWPRDEERLSVGAARGLPVLSATPPPPRAVALAVPPVGGYLVVDSAGRIRPFGVAAEGDLAGRTLGAPVTGAAGITSGTGYWMVAADGGLFSFGDATFLGSLGGLVLEKPIVGMAATPSGQGYWMVAADGGLFSFGDATFLGSLGGLALEKPIVGMAATPSGQGYWMVAADGGLFGFGDAAFLGSASGQPLSQPVTAMARTPAGAGYWMVAADGGIFSFGDATFLGSGLPG